ncbi:filamentation induced by cAMP protein [Corynebacterium variabile DSM 44702]|uniref:Filamentation induced by cAMP protein n=1 Tax=Corynebacterium variabile (strain DSM 44702 / CIP 107183 / JCM 12073 / NCIMB 30131) TaxID=858619 RepID=G0HGF1_CORVD|nr:Fic family protein [Corynebacterium variabile]AEK37318.1 filamentation induced by cAMP protein [Corynebacterium variabile DSM 44702]
MDSTARPVYTPFPSFATWEASDVSYRDVDSAITRFAVLKSEVSRDALDHPLETARRAAAVDTNAIEGVFSTNRGFTRTVAEKTGSWEQAMADKGAHVRPAFEDTLSGFELILDRMTGKRPVTAQFIRELHATMLRSQETHTVYAPVNGEFVPQTQELPKGEYKQYANSPTRPDGTVHTYAPVEDTAPEMSRLIEELRSAEFENAHPITQAAYAHYAFVCIHPFADGNGRVARALASIYLYRSPGVPLVIYQDQRTHYIDALEAADRGQFHTLKRFIANQVVDTVNVIDAELSAPVSGAAADELSALLSGNQTPETVLNAADRLKEILVEELRARMELMENKLNLPFLVHRSLIGTAPTASEGYALIGDNMAVTVSVSVKSPREIFATWPMVICRGDMNEAEFDLVAVTGSGRVFGIYLRELMPTVSESFRQRVGFFADAVVEEFLAQVTAVVKRGDS